ncbi:MAG: hypothetical protein WKF82_02860 [Nocardioidaceae bacterium]
MRSTARTSAGCDRRSGCSSTQGAWRRQDAKLRASPNASTEERQIIGDQINDKVQAAYDRAVQALLERLTTGAVDSAGDRGRWSQGCAWTRRALTSNVPCCGPRRRCLASLPTGVQLYQQLPEHNTIWLGSAAFPEDPTRAVESTDRTVTVHKEYTDPHAYGFDIGLLAEALGAGLIMRGDATRADDVRGWVDRFREERHDTVNKIHNLLDQRDRRGGEPDRRVAAHRRLFARQRRQDHRNGAASHGQLRDLIPGYRLSYRGNTAVIVAHPPPPSQPASPPDHTGPTPGPDDATRADTGAQPAARLPATVIEVPAGADLFGAAGAPVVLLEDHGPSQITARLRSGGPRGRPCGSPPWPSLGPPSCSTPAR